VFAEVIELHARADAGAVQPGDVHHQRPVGRHVGLVGRGRGRAAVGRPAGAHRQRAEEARGTAA